MIVKNNKPSQLNQSGTPQFPHHITLPFIEGDGIGKDITPVMQTVVNAAITRAYGDSRSVLWEEIYAGEKAKARMGHVLPPHTLERIRASKIAIKGPLATPVGGGIRSLNVALRQQLDLYICLRPIRYFNGVPSPVRLPEKVNMVIFRENTEDIYTGIEWPAGSKEVIQVIEFLKKEMGVNLRFSESCGLGIKPVSKAGSERLVQRAIQYAIDHAFPSVTLVHKGNIMKFTEGAFKEWGYGVARDQFGACASNKGSELIIKNLQSGHDIIIKDVIADAFLQNILLKPEDYSVIATLNLNGDYISDALAAQVGGIGIAPGANLGEDIAIFEATHGTAPELAGQDKANPSSLILSAEMMLRYIGWTEAADLIIQSIALNFQQKKVTYDFAHLMSGAQLMSCSGFGKAIIENIKV